MTNPHEVDTKDPIAVAEELKGLFREDEGKDSITLIDHAVGDVVSMFGGGWPGYQPIDMEYHDLDHTLQVTVCMAHMLDGYRREGGKPALGVRDRELALLAALLHDTGFLKQEGDLSGTGAKYTFIHEKRSCAFARKYLQGMGITETEIGDICSAVMCTGPRNRIGNVAFRSAEARQVALFLVTADYLAQMSAADYLEKLPLLYLEFVEAYGHEGIPPEDRPFQSLGGLLEATPGFWRDYVLPLLDGEAEAVYRYLSPKGIANPYLQSIDENIGELERRLKEQV
ncbi:hypothetical protein HZ994_00010 [Akkermansiaceae bacterium]|nr:hypothetical protein HZ994_00010 [Akkermansiaceae bacterium]